MSKPAGKAEVTDALVDATIDLIVERGLGISVREIAARAGVNHGLVHLYFGGKPGLLRAAFDEVNRRAYAEQLPSGFPPPDLAHRRGGELAKAIARIRLEADEDLFSSHPVVTSWREALARTRPDLSADEVAGMVAVASAVALGWALFADHLCASLEVGEARRAELDARVAALVTELGGITTTADDEGG